MNKILIVGGNVAGITAALSAKKKDPDCKVVILSSEPYKPYRRPAIPSLISGEISDLNDAGIFPLDYLKSLGIEYFSGVEVKSLNLEKKEVHLIEIGTDNAGNMNYDNLVLATGGIPSLPKLTGLDKKGVCTFTTYDAAKEILKYAVLGSGVVVVGAGFIGLEIAEALLKKGLKVYFNVRSRILRRLLEADMSDYLIKEYTKHGLITLTGDSISEIGGNGSVSYVKFKDNVINVNMVVFGMGVIANVKLLKGTSVRIGQTGAIAVNEKMQTNVPNVFAAGDCAESLDLTTGQYVYAPVGSIAAEAGEIAGTNAAGGDIATRGFLRVQADNIFGIEVISIGHSSTTAKEVNLNIKLKDLSQESLRFNIGRKYPPLIKVILDESDSIVGAQVITRRYGSIYSYGLLNAMVNNSKFSDFLKTWKLSLKNLDDI